MMDIQIGNTQNRKSLGFQVCCSLSVIFQCSRIIVLRPIQLYHNVRFATIEIDDIGADDMLPAKS